MTNTVLDLERNWLVRPLEAEDVRRAFFFIFFIVLGEFLDPMRGGGGRCCFRGQLKIKVYID